MPAPRPAPAFTGSIWPNGQFGIARAKETSIPPPYRQPPESLELMMDRWGFAAHGAAYAPYASPLGLSILFNSHTPPRKAVRRGLRGISSHGRKTVSNGAWLLQKRYGRRCLGFLTVTFPAMALTVYRDVVAGFSEIVRQFVQRLRRRLMRYGLPGSIVGCVEIQPARFQTTGIPWLHLHLVFTARKPGRGWACRPADFREDWKSAVCNVVPSLESLDWSASENIEQVRDSAEAYLGKYMSKGASEVGAIAESEPDMVPSSWYVCTNALRKAIRDRRVFLSGPGADYLVSQIEQLSESVMFSRPVSVETRDGFKLAVGYYGRIPYSDVSLYSDIMKLHRCDTIKDRIL